MKILFKIFKTFFPFWYGLNSIVGATYGIPSNFLIRSTNCLACSMGLVIAITWSFRDMIIHLLYQAISFCSLTTSPITIIAGVWTFTSSTFLIISPMVPIISLWLILVPFSIIAIGVLELFPAFNKLPTIFFRRNILISELKFLACWILF